jgi:hypothetical protein
MLGVRLPTGVRRRSVPMLAAGRSAMPVPSSGWARVVIPSVLDHEVLATEWGEPIASRELPGEPHLGEIPIPSSVAIEI